MSDNVKNKHLTYSDRQIIEKGICNDSSKSAIASFINDLKDINRGEDIIS